MPGGRVSISYSWKSWKLHRNPFVWICQKYNTGYLFTAENPTLATRGMSRPSFRGEGLLFLALWITGFSSEYDGKHNFSFLSIPTLEDTINIRQFCYVTLQLLTLAVSWTLIYCGQNCTPRLLYGRFHKTAELGSCTSSFRSTKKLDGKRKSDNRTAHLG